MSKEKRRNVIEQMMRPRIEESVPNVISPEERDKMVNDILTMYSDPKAILEYVNDPVFKNEFWNNISYQTKRITAAYKTDTQTVDVEEFMETPMKELTKYTDNKLRTTIDNSSPIKLKRKKYYVGEGKKRYLWFATRMGQPTIKDAPGIEIIQTYNLLTPNQIVGLLLKKLL